jgi:formimidoylglutamate deiminase
MTLYTADHLWTPEGFVSGQRASTSTDDAAERVRLGSVALPGIVNAHSHAFQRAMAGLAEYQTDPSDSFWTWRETMYRFAGLVEPEDLYAIAAQLYVEMLEAGYTRVCEFHCLHHQTGGRPYADPAAMSQAVLAAARDTGIAITLLPVLYMAGGFDGRALSQRQQRFSHSVDSFLQLLSRLRAHEDPQCTIGIALHSLRAVPPAALAEVLAAEAGHARPIHIHIAEQMPEVSECLTLRGQRPVAWLLDHATVDARWSLVHATHMDAAEIVASASSGATVAVCPTTEANLGDGIFPLQPYLAAGGAISIGSDSHVSISPVEELRWLEYAQRLQAMRRNVAVGTGQAHVGANLFAAIQHGGQKSAHGNTAMPAEADFIALDDAHPLLCARLPEQILDAWVFSGNRPLVRDVMAGGRWIVRDGMHPRREKVAEDYRRVLAKLLAQM